MSSSISLSQSPSLVSSKDAKGIGSDFLSPLPKDIKFHIYNFLGDQDLRALDLVSHAFRSSMPSICQMRTCSKKTFIPESLPPGVNYKTFLLNQFPMAIGVDFYEEHLGKVDTVPKIPRRFIDMAPQPGFKLLFIPEYITITVPPDSSLVLDETTAVDNKKPRLIEDPNVAPQGKIRDIKVPLTPNNIVLLFQKCLKKKHSQFGGNYEYSWRNILDQNGDVGLGPSHWSYQQEDLIGVGSPYRSQNGTKGQVEIAQDKGLEIVPLGERILFQLSSYVQFGHFPKFNYIERTSTDVHDDEGLFLKSCIWWPLSDAVFRMDCYLSRNLDSSVGAAAQASLGGSQAIS